MNYKPASSILRALIIGFVITSLATLAVGQGKGRGGGGNNGGGGGNGRGGGPPSGVGVDRGLGNASERSNGRSDEGLGRASDHSNGRSDAGLERARARSNNMHDADRDLQDHPNLPRALHVNANDLRSGYQAALATNPNLKFGQYVAATRLAQNHGSRFPNITRAAILDRLAAGDSIGQALHNLGMNSDDAKAAKKRAEREIKAARQ